MNAKQWYQRSTWGANLSNPPRMNFHQPKLTKLNILLLFHLHSLPLPTLSSLCRTSCNSIPIRYPFALDDGCGAPQFRRFLNCSTALFLQTPSGNYKVQSIDYNKHSITIYDPLMSTCSILQPHHAFILSDPQSLLIPPSSSTVFALLNCSISSPLLNHYKSLCFNFSSHSCDELYTSCNSFKTFTILTNSSPPCCFTSYNTVKFMSLNVLDCSHFTTVIDVDDLEGTGVMDWVYGIKLSFSEPDLGCDRCVRSGGECGFDVDSEGMVCLCSSSFNSSRECVAGSVTDEGGWLAPWIFSHVSCLILAFFFTRF